MLFRARYAVGLAIAKSICLTSVAVGQNIPEAPPIPVRFVQVSSGCASDGCIPLLTEAELEAVIERTNTIYTATNVRLFQHSSVAIDAPAFRDSKGGGPKLAWGDVKYQVSAMVPGTPLDAFPDEETKAANLFLEAAQACYGDPMSILTIVSDNAGSSSSFPWSGRLLLAGARGMFKKGDRAHPVAGPYAGNHFAHELGHYFGLRHVWDVLKYEEQNPASGVNWTHADFYDVLYCETSSARPWFLSAASDVKTCEAAGHHVVPLIASGSPNTQSNIDTEPIKTVFSEDESSSVTWRASENVHPRGVMRDRGGVNDPGNDKYRYGVNVMGYYSSWGLSDPHFRMLAFLSDTQILVASLYRMHSTGLASRSLEKLVEPRGQPPRGCRLSFASTMRAQLGMAAAFAAVVD